MTDTLKQARRLHKLGFAIIWIKPKSKVPEGSGWTTGPRKSIEQLEREYRPGQNIGVRLGTPSVLGGQYLAVIDVDVKGEDPRYNDEAVHATAAFKKLVSLKAAPIVISGRGGGSRHYYIRTVLPFKTFNFAGSAEYIRCLQPSKPPSKRDREELSEADVALGYRISRAWEVSLYSDGRQVVLPPSVHPDSGLEYKWFQPLVSVEDIPLVDITAAEARAERRENPPTKKTATVGNKETPKEEKFDFTPEDVEIEWLPLPDPIRKGIISGDGVDDRSGFLLPAASALHSAGLSRDACLSVLTDTRYFIGSVGFDHAQTRDRARAAYWVYRYSLKKIEGERDPGAVFKDAPPLPPVGELSFDEMALEADELLGDVWRSEDHGYYLQGGKKPDYRAMLTRFQADHPYKSIADMKAVFIFRDTHYRFLSATEIKAFAEKILEPEPEAKLREEFYQKVLVNEVANRDFFIETTEDKINFKNGILDLSNGLDLKPHSPEVGFRGVLPYNFEPNARCPEFSRWIKGVMLGDADLIAILQEFMGYIVRGGPYTFHKALWLEGTGRNGKSTFIDVLKALIGPGNFSTLSIKSLVGDKFSSSDLDGKIANFSEETSPEELKDSGPFKNLTGDGDISAQKKFGDIYTFRNRAKLIMSYNTIPDLKDLTDGMMSRPIIVPFRKKIKEDEQDHGIKKKLLAELPGIFNFALAGWKRLDERGWFTASEKSQDALKAIKKESCNVQQWIEHYVEFTEETDTFKQTTELYSAYKSHESRQYSLAHFGRRLHTHPEMVKRYNRANRGARYWGLKLL